MASVRHAATKLGLRVVGFGGWNAHAHTYEALVQRVASARPDGVFLDGSVDISNGPAVVKDLRAALGQGVQILLPDGFSPLSAFAHLAGPAAEGITMSLPGRRRSAYAARAVSSSPTSVRRSDAPSSSTQ